MPKERTVFHPQFAGETVYAARIVNTPFVKIGHSGNPYSRVKALHYMLSKHKIACELVVAIEVSCGSAYERALHQYFSPYRVHGEWFYLLDQQIYKAFSSRGLRRIFRVMAEHSAAYFAWHNCSACTQAYADVTKQLSFIREARASSHHRREG